MIRLESVLREMEKVDKRGNPVPFTIRFCTANLQANTGGEILELKGAVLAVKLKSIPPYVKNELQKEQELINKRNANHWVNGTRNLWHNNGYVKTHIRLITSFNNQEVIY